MPRTALHDAKSVEEVHEALRAGVDVDARDDENGRTALMVAAQQGAEPAAGMRVLQEARELAQKRGGPPGIGAARTVHLADG